MMLHRSDNWVIETREVSLGISSDIVQEQEERQYKKIREDK